jgi:hypothetical protein
MLINISIGILVTGATLNMLGPVEVDPKNNLSSASNSPAGNRLTGADVIPAIAGMLNVPHGIMQSVASAGLINSIISIASVSCELHATIFVTAEPNQPAENTVV